MSGIKCTYLKCVSCRSWLSVHYFTVYWQVAPHPCLFTLESPVAAIMFNTVPIWELNCICVCVYHLPSVAVTELLSIRSYLQGLEICSYCYIAYTHLELSTLQLSTGHCARRYGAAELWNYRKRTSFIHAAVVTVVNGVAQTPYKAKISQHDNYQP